MDTCTDSHLPSQSMYFGGTFNPFMVNIIIDTYDLITIFLIVLGYFV